MNQSIVRVHTADGYVHHGLLTEPEKKNGSIVIHIHGSAGSFYESTFYPALTGAITGEGFAFLTTNTRGHGVYNVETGTKYTGAAVELFEECILDIDAWISFALAQGYESVLLSGHSFGTNKIQYYARRGPQKQVVRALILLGFTDSYGGQLAYLENVQKKNEDVLREAEQLISAGKPYQLLSDPFINWGELPQSAISYKNFMSPESALSTVLPLRAKTSLPEFAAINVPMLGIVGDRNECTVIPPQEAVAFLNRENTQADCHMITNCNHSYVGKEHEMAALVQSFVQRLG